jgi:heme oxygenase
VDDDDRAVDLVLTCATIRQTPGAAARSEPFRLRSIFFDNDGFLPATRACLARSFLPPALMSARTMRRDGAVAALRAATQDKHATVDVMFSALPLGDIAGYRCFLRAQARAHLPIERALTTAGAAGFVADWPARLRSEALIADLAELGEPVPPPLAAPAFASRAATLGGIYVLEGSRLGGKLLVRLAPMGAPTRFIAAPTRSGSWHDLLATLDATVSPGERDMTIEAARLVFDRFADAGRQELEPIAA